MCAVSTVLPIPQELLPRSFPARDSSHGQKKGKSHHGIADMEMGTRSFRATCTVPADLEELAVVKQCPYAAK